MTGPTCVCTRRTAERALPLFLLMPLLARVLWACKALESSPSPSTASKPLFQSKRVHAPNPPLHMAFVSPRPCALSSRSVATIAGEEKGVGVLCMIKREGREEKEGGGSTCNQSEPKHTREGEEESKAGRLKQSQRGFKKKRKKKKKKKKKKAKTTRWGVVAQAAKPRHLLFTVS